MVAFANFLTSIGSMRLGCKEEHFSHITQEPSLHQASTLLASDEYDVAGRPVSFGSISPAVTCHSAIWANSMASVAAVPFLLTFSGKKNFLRTERLSLCTLSVKAAWSRSFNLAMIDLRFDSKLSQVSAIVGILLVRAL